MYALDEIAQEGLERHGFRLTTLCKSLEEVDHQRQLGGGMHVRCCFRALSLELLWSEDAPVYIEETDSSHVAVHHAHVIHQPEHFEEVQVFPQLYRVADFCDL